ncbi:MAG TPA: hypothetical protein DEP23_09860 [Ruminococcaceae bacterium]|nr:hypothetical protein [Oscillospiraceae bacterium]
MYPVTEAFNAAITSSDVNMKARVVLRANGETYHLEHKDIQKDSLKVTYGVLPGDGIALGGVSGADLSITLTNDSGIFNHVQLNYAEIRPFVDVEISPGVFEPIPLGVFEVDTVDRMAVTFDRNFESIPLKAADRMVRFDLPFSEVDIPFPGSALHLLTAVCQRCGVPLGSTNFMNSDYVIQERPEGEISCRDIVSCIAEIAGCWAQCDRTGFLVLRWFKNPKFVQEAVLDGNTDTAYGGNFTDDWYINTYDGGAFKADAPQVVFTSGMFYDFSIDDAPITITGVSLETEDKTYLVGSPRYVMSIDNPLIQTQIPEVLSSIHDKIAGFTYIPFHGVCLDNPAWEAGDMVLLDNIEGKSYRTILTGYEYVFDGRCNVIADGESDREHNFRPTSERKYSRLVKMIGKKQEQINAMDIAVRNATAIISGMWGGHKIDGDKLDEQYHGNTFIADHPDIDQAQQIWRINLGGIGFSSTGVAGPYSSAWTSDGTFATNLIVANMIKSGLLQSLNGESWIDLDNGSFQFAKGSVTFDDTNGVRAYKPDGSYTQMSGDGLTHHDSGSVREYHYLSQTGTTGFSVNGITHLLINLDSAFTNKNFVVTVSVSYVSTNGDFLNNFECLISNVFYSSASFEIVAYIYGRTIDFSSQSIGVVSGGSMTISWTAIA